MHTRFIYLVVVMAGCTADTSSPTGPMEPGDAGEIDAGEIDARPIDAGLIDDPECEAGTHMCSGGSTSVLRCNADGTMQTTEICTAGSRCVASGARAECRRVLCTMGELGCTDDSTAYTCDETGTVRTETPCGAGRCSAGTCTNQVCEPGSVRCAADFLPGAWVGLRQVCNVHGTGYQDLPCGGEQSCSAGVCRDRVCPAGFFTARCVPGSLTGREVCSDDGLTWSSMPCADTQSCSDGTCDNRTCAPGAFSCLDTNTRRVCNDDGLGYTPVACAGGATHGYACTGRGTCTERICAPGSASSVCASATARQVCNAEGLGFSSSACAGGQSCQAGVCAVRCGDGVIGGEECDDGNTISGDGCSSTCRSETGPRSCLERLMEVPGSSSGVYMIDPDGPGPTAPLSVYCDMSSDGGGWTMVVAQFEAYPETNWNQGTTFEYDPSLRFRRGFALRTAQIPTHTHTAFGRDTNATFVDYVNYVYTTGNIALTSRVGIRTGLEYQVHRSATGWYGGNDPETLLRDTSSPGFERTCVNGWCNTLTFDRIGPPGRFALTWSFSPNGLYAESRGFGMLGDVTGSSESYAWTVWVR